MKLTIKTVKEVKGFGAFNDKFSKGSLVKNFEKAKALLINGTLEDGRQVYFFTPSAIIAGAEGFLNYETLKNDGQGFFLEKNGKTKGHDNVLAYEGGDEPAVAIEDTTKVVPAVEEGQTIDIDFNVKRECKNGKFQLNYVRLNK